MSGVLSRFIVALCSLGGPIGAGGAVTSFGMMSSSGISVQSATFTGVEVLKPGDLIGELNEDNSSEFMRISVNLKNFIHTRVVNLFKHCFDLRLIIQWVI